MSSHRFPASTIQRKINQLANERDNDDKLYANRGGQVSAIILVFVDLVYSFVGTNRAAENKKLEIVPGESIRLSKST